MSCCDDAPKKEAPTVDIEKILATLPVSVHGYYDTGGHQLQGLQFVMPPDDKKQRTYGRPTFHADGTIEYPKAEGSPPKDISGFYRDEVNPFLFRPLWGECFLRMQGIQMNPKSGEIDVRMVCNNPEAGTHHKFVTAQQCADCPVRKLKERKNPA